MAEELCVDRVPLFQGLELADRQKIESLLQRRNLKKGEILIQPEMSENLAIIEKGTARFYRLTEDGSEQVQRLLQEGDYLGDLWLLGMRNLDGYLEMESDSEACILSRSDFMHLLDQNSAIAVKLLQDKATQVASLQKQVQLLSLPNIKTRILTYLRYLPQHDRQVHLTMKMKDLASYLGTSPETLSREFAKLEKAGVIKRTRREVILSDYNFT